MTSRWQHSSIPNPHFVPEKPTSQGRSDVVKRHSDPQPSPFGIRKRVAPTSFTNLSSKASCTRGSEMPFTWLDLGGDVQAPGSIGAPPASCRSTKEWMSTLGRGRGSRDRAKKNDQTECPQRYATHHIAHPTVRTVVQFLSQLCCGPAPHSITGVMGVVDVI